MHLLIHSVGDRPLPLASHKHSTRIQKLLHPVLKASLLPVCSSTCYRGRDCEKAVSCGTGRELNRAAAVTALTDESSFFTKSAFLKEARQGAKLTRCCSAIVTRTLVPKLQVLHDPRAEKFGSLSSAYAAEFMYQDEAWAPEQNLGLY